MAKSDTLGEELNFLAQRLDLEKISKATFFPKYFEIETIRNCNAKCQMCPVWEKGGKDKKMDDELFYKLTEEISYYQNWVKTVCLSRNGEPLLDKNLTGKIKRLKNYGIRHVTFSTNASLLTQKKAASLLKSGLDDIMFSIDGSTKETFEYIRRGLNFEQVVDNCLRFISMRNEIGDKPSIRVRMVLQDANKHEEREFKKFWLAKLSENDIVYSKQMNSWGNQLSSYGTSINKTEGYSKIPCISPWSSMIIHYDGKVPLCGVDFENKFIMGDTNNSKIREIWQSEKFDKVRQKHASGKRNDIELCKGCNIWDLEEKKIYKNER